MTINAPKRGKGRKNSPVKITRADGTVEERPPYDLATVRVIQNERHVGQHHARSATAPNVREGSKYDPNRRKR